MFRFLLASFALLTLIACSNLPDDIQPVQNFQIDRYLGKWYEIARLENRFERGLSDVTATYLADGDEITVVNRGYNAEKMEWVEAQGHARFYDETDVGYLEVSFFGPFFGSYIIVELGEDYDYAFVTDKHKDYLWLLARTPEVSTQLERRFLMMAKQKGYDVDEIIWTPQN